MLILIDVLKLATLNTNQANDRPVYALCRPCLYQSFNNYAALIPRLHNGVFDIMVQGHGNY